MEHSPERNNENNKQDDFIADPDCQLPAQIEPFSPHAPLTEASKAFFFPDYAYLKQLISESVDDPANKWMPAVKDSFHSVFSKNDGENPVVLCKVFARLKDVELEPLFQLIIDCELRTEWDKIIKELSVYEKIDDNSDVIYCVIKTPPGFSNRDYVQYRHFLHSKRNSDQIEKYELFARDCEYYVLYLKSVEIPDIPPVKGLVRADTIITGYLIEKDGNDLNFTMVLQTDVKGYIPKSIFNRVSTRVPGMWLKNLLAGYAVKYPKKPEKP